MAADNDMLSVLVQHKQKGDQVATVEPGCQAVLAVNRWLDVKCPLACCQKAFLQRRI